MDIGLIVLVAVGVVLLVAAVYLLLSRSGRAIYKGENPPPAPPTQQQPARGRAEEQVILPPANKPAPPAAKPTDSGTSPVPPPAPASPYQPAPQPVPAGPPKPVVSPPPRPTEPGSVPPPAPPAVEEAEETTPAPFVPEPLPSAPITPGGFGGMPVPEIEDIELDDSIPKWGTADYKPKDDLHQVEFSAYYPKEARPEKWEKLHAYIFRGLAAGAVEHDAIEQMGEREAEFRGVRMPATTHVPEGALVTATPHMDGFQFNPPSVSLGFYKDWHRFDFELRAKGAPMHHSINGILTFSVEGIIVADVPLSIFVGDIPWKSNNDRTSSTAKLYQAIFCSYSHRDTTIVTRAERAYKALGMDYLRDVVSLKSGQDWSDELLQLIDRADVFQLFWSNAAADSQHVRFEWEHALKLSAGRPHFVRPVYWEDPKPSIPPELKHIHFAYQPDLGQ